MASTSSWGENAWNVGSWGEGGVNETVTFEGWGVDSWGSDPWGETSVTTDAVSTNIGSVSIQIDVNQNVTGQSLSIVTGNEGAFSDVGVDVTGISLSTDIGSVETLRLQGVTASTGVGTVDIAANGNIFVNVAEHTINTAVGQIVADAGASVPTTGNNLSSNIGSVIAKADVNVEVTNSAPLFQLTTEGNAQLSTAQAKFGTASLLLDGTDDYIETTTNLDLSSTDFTIDLWIRPDNITGYKGIWQSGTSTTMQSYLLGNAVYWSVNPSTIITTAVTVNANEWTMLSYERQGNTHRIYKNGTLEDTATTANKQDNGTFSIGKNGFGDFDGYIDEVRVSDIARYTGSSFTEPTSEFEFDSNTNVLVHLDGANGSTDIKSADDTSFPGVISEGQVTAIPGVEVDVTGIAMTMAMGEEDIDADANVSVTGVELTSSIGTAEQASFYPVTGIQMSITVGSVTVTGSANIDVTGIELTSSTGTPNITAWQEIDPGVTNVWTEVDLAA
jgi:hypothetical protein